MVLRRPRARWASAMSASVPPSPLLSARMKKMTYLMVTNRVSVHSTSDTMPSTAVSSGRWVWDRVSRIA